MEQVKGFLFDVKDAYDADRHEWLRAKEEFKTQLEMKEQLWLECYMRLSEIVNVIRALQQSSNGASVKDFLASGGLTSADLGGDYAEETSMMMDAVNRQESMNNLVGGTTSLLEFKLGAGGTRSLLAGKLSSSIADSPNSSLLNASSLNNENSDLQIIDLTKDRKDLDVEFDQVGNFFFFTIFCYSFCY